MKEMKEHTSSFLKQIYDHEIRPIKRCGNIIIQESRSHVKKVKWWTMTPFQYWFNTIMEIIDIDDSVTIVNLYNKK